MEGVPNAHSCGAYQIRVIPMKISSKSLDNLETIYAGIRRFVMKDMENRYFARTRERVDNRWQLEGEVSSCVLEIISVAGKSGVKVK